LCGEYPLHPLDGARAKVERAEEHREDFGAAWRAFIDTRPYGIECHFDPQEVAYTTSFQVFRPVPLPVLAVAGDFIHNLRSAIDYVAAELVAAHGGNVRAAAFPLYIKERDFIFDVRFRARKRGPGPLDRIPTTGDAWTFIERLQPYQRGERAREDPLYSLNLLSNRDKHRMLNPAYGAPLGVNGYTMMIWNSEARCVGVEVLWTAGMPLEHKTPLGRFHFDRRAADPDMQVQNPIPIDIMFRGDGKEGPRKGFAVMQEHVAKIVRDAEVFFL